jgi:hypothetical protein
MKRLIAAIALAGGLIGGGVGVPLVLTAQPASALPGPNSPWTLNKRLCVTQSGHLGVSGTNTNTGNTMCFRAPPRPH